MVCWEYNKCKEDVRNKCPAYLHEETRCWTIPGACRGSSLERQACSRETQVESKEPQGKPLVGAVKNYACATCGYYLMRQQKGFETELRRISL